MKKSIKVIVFGLCLSLSACEYSNTFQGTFNNIPATMIAYSKNTNRYCIALTLTAADVSKSSFVSAQDVYDANDLFKPVDFDTKNTPCSENLSEYLVGTRSTEILSKREISKCQQLGAHAGRMVYYNEYNYQEHLTFTLKSVADDQVLGTFIGTGKLSLFEDTDHPTRHGPIVPIEYCN